MMQRRQQGRWPLGWGLGVAIALGVVLLSSDLRAQQVYIQPETSAQAVYELLPPEFPTANTYVRRESGDVDEDNTLLSRLIAYHIYVKNRSPFFRFDWKLTLADFLGAHEAPSPNQYPSNNTLNENPLAGDRDLIRSFDRRQRDELVQALVTVFNSGRRRAAESEVAEPAAAPTPAESAPPATGRPRNPSLPEPGAADLLR